MLLCNLPHSSSLPFCAPISPSPLLLTHEVTSLAEEFLTTDGVPTGKINLFIDTVPTRLPILWYIFLWHAYRGYTTGGSKLLLLLLFCFIYLLLVCLTFHVHFKLRVLHDASRLEIPKVAPRTQTTLILSSLTPLNFYHFSSPRGYVIQLGKLKKTVFMQKPGKVN